MMHLEVCNDSFCPNICDGESGVGSSKSMLLLKAIWYHYYNEVKVVSFPDKQVNTYHTPPAVDDCMTDFNRARQEF